MKVRIGIVLLVVMSVMTVGAGFSAQQGMSMDSRGGVTLVYSGTVQGEFLPTLACSATLAGGLSRHGYLLEEKRQGATQLLFVDNGNFFLPPGEERQKVLAEIGVKVMHHKGVDAMNIGPIELSLGAQFLAGAAAEHGINFVSSNIIAPAEFTWLQQVVFKEVGGLRIAILGILPQPSPGWQVHPSFVQSLQVEAPEVALGRILDQLEGQAEVVVLLSQLDLDETERLVAGFPGINLAIARSQESLCEMGESTSQLVLPDSMYGKFFLAAEITRQADDTVVIRQEPPIHLDDSVPHVDAVDSMIAGGLKEWRKAKKASLAARQELQQSGGTVLKPMSQEEFFATLNQTNAELKKLRPEPEGEEIGARMLLDGVEVPVTIRRIPGGALPPPAEGGANSTTEVKP